MILNLLFGQVSLLDHVRLIPVFAMASSFLTAAWPSLLQSLGQSSVTLYDTTAPLDSVSIPMSQTYEDDETNQEVFTFLPNTRDGPEHPLQGLQRFSNLASPISIPISGQNRNTQPFRPSTTSPTRPHELIQMGPSSTCSGGTYQSGTSLSLCSQGGPPSEMSSIVVTNFFPDFTAGRIFETTQRRRDIQSLGQGPSSGDNDHNRAKGTEDQSSLINMVLRKVQSI